MQTLGKFALGLTTVSRNIRLGLVLVIWLPTLLIFPTNILSLYLLMVIPLALTAWLFRYRGGFALYFLVLLQITLNNVLDYNFAWPQHLIVNYTTALIIFLTEILLVSYLRTTIENASHARQQLLQAYEQQRSLNVFKDDLLINLSHELRTPLTEVHGYLALLRDFRDSLDAETEATFTDNAFRACEELLVLTGNMREAIDADQHSTPTSRKVAPIKQLFQEVIDYFPSQITGNYALQTNIPADLKVLASLQQVRRVLYNLLSNAFKYSPLQSQITITAVPDDAENAAPQVLISIQDTGLGIPQDEIAHLFQKFVRLKRDHLGTVRGSGLGLYISKQLIENMGGTIWVESTGIPGEGSKFCITLPQVPSDLNSNASQSNITSIQQSPAVVEQKAAS